MATTKKKSNIIRSLHKLPDELLSEILAFLPPKNLKNLSKIKTLRSKIGNNHLMWRKIYMLNNLPPHKVKQEDGYLEGYKRFYRMRRCWIKGQNENKKVFMTNQTDITHIQCNDHFIVTSSDDQTIKIFDTDGNLKKSLIGHFGGVWTFQWHRDLIISGSTDKSVRIWDFVSGWPLKHLKGHESTVRCLKTYKNFIISGARDSTIKVWNLDGVLLHTLKGHAESVRCIDVYYNMLVSGSYDGTVIMWDYMKGRCVKKLKSHLLRVYAVKIGRKHIVSGGQDSLVNVSDIKGNFIVSLYAHRSIVAWLEIINDNVHKTDHCLISGGAEGYVCIWDLKTGHMLNKIVENAPITTIAVKNGFVLIGMQCKVKMYDIKTGKFVRVLLDEVSRVYKICCTEQKIVIGFKRNFSIEVAVFSYDLC